MSKTSAQPLTNHDRYLVPGLVRGLDLLQLFTQKRTKFTLAEFANELGVTRSAVFRVAYTLSELGFLTHDPKQGSFMLGPSILRLGQGHLGLGRLVETALPHLEVLRDTCRWSAHLGVLEGVYVRYLIRVPWCKGASSIVKAGTQLPAHMTSMGRVLLAAFDDNELLELYRSFELASSAGCAPRGIAAVLAQHRLDRLHSSVTQIGLFEAGVVSVAAPIQNATGKTIAAINVAVPMTQLAGPHAVPDVARQVRRTAAMLSCELGFVPDDKNASGASDVVSV